MKYSLAIGHEMGLIGKRKWLSQWHSQAVGEEMRLPGERNRVSLTSCWIKMSWYHCPEQKDCHSHPGKRWDYLAVREGSLSQPELVIEWDGSLNAFLATKDGGNDTHWLVAKDEMQQAVPSVTTYSLWKLWCWSLQEMWLRLKKGSMTVLPVLTYCWSLDEIWCDRKTGGVTHILLVMKHDILRLSGRKNGNVTYKLLVWDAMCEMRLSTSLGGKKRSTTHLLLEWNVSKCLAEEGECYVPDVGPGMRWDETAWDKWQCDFLLAVVMGCDVRRMHSRKSVVSLTSCWSNDEMKLEWDRKRGNATHFLLIMGCDMMRLSNRNQGQCHSQPVSHGMTGSEIV